MHRLTKYSVMAIMLALQSWTSTSQCIADGLDDYESHEVDGNLYDIINVEANKFFVKLFNDAATKTIGSTKNFLISPISIWATLFILLVGADDQSATELKRLLNIKYNNKIVLINTYAWFRDHVTLTIGPFKMSNIMYRNISMQNNPCLSNTQLGLQFDSLLFQDVRATINAINTWVEMQTQHEVRNTVKERDLSLTDNTLIMVNAVHFDPIRGRASVHIETKMKFFIKPGQHVMVNMMQITDAFDTLLNVYRNPSLDYEAVLFRHRYPHIHMIFLRPIHTTVDDLIPKLTYNNLRALFKAMRQGPFQQKKIIMPKFKVTYATDVKQFMKDNGVNIMFTQQQVNFPTFTGEITSVVDIMKHKIHFAFDEPFANLTIKKFNTRDRNSVIFNKSFVFFIKHGWDSKSHTGIYFAGVIRNPRR